VTTDSFLLNTDPYYFNSVSGLTGYG